MSEIEKGRNIVMSGLEKLTLAELEAEIPLWGGTKKRQYGLLIYLSEIFPPRRTDRLPQRCR